MNDNKKLWKKKLESPFRPYRIYAAYIATRVARSVVCVPVCALDAPVGRAITAEPIEMAVFINAYRLGTPVKHATDRSDRKTGGWVDRKFVKCPHT